MDRSGGGGSRRKAVPGDARGNNRALVLRTMFREGPLKRADLARETNLTRVTTSDLAAELLADGPIEELGTREGSDRVGKPATVLPFTVWTLRGFVGGVPASSRRRPWSTGRAACGRSSP